MKKPHYVSHFLVLKDLILGIDVREKSARIFYLTSRIENIKVDLVKEGISFMEDIKKETRYSYYKPYLLVPSERNILIALNVLRRYETEEVLSFLTEKRSRNFQEHYPQKTADR